MNIYSGRGKPAAVTRRWQRVKPMTGIATQRGQGGFASVEMAMVTPFLVILLLVTAEFSRAFYEYNTLTKSVRHAARYAAINSIDGTGLVQLDQFSQAIRNLAVSGSTSGGPPLLTGLSTNDIDVQIVNPAGVTQEVHIQVTGAYQFVPLFPVIDGLGFLKNDVDTQFVLRTQATMRAQR